MSSLFRASRPTLPPPPPPPPDVETTEVRRAEDEERRRLQSLKGRNANIFSDSLGNTNAGTMLGG
jgi:hypothetical protein